MYINKQINKIIMIINSIKTKSVCIFFLYFADTFNNTEILSGTILSDNKQTSCVWILRMYINDEMFEVFKFLVVFIVI